MTPGLSCFFMPRCSRTSQNAPKGRDRPTLRPPKTEVVDSLSLTTEQDHILGCTMWWWFWNLVLLLGCTYFCIAFGVVCWTNVWGVYQFLWLRLVYFHRSFSVIFWIHVFLLHSCLSQFSGWLCNVDVYILPPALLHVATDGPRLGHYKVQGGRGSRNRAWIERSNYNLRKRELTKKKSIIH